LKNELQQKTLSEKIFDY